VEDENEIRRTAVHISRKKEKEEKEEKIHLSEKSPLFACPAVVSGLLIIRIPMTAAKL